MGHLARMQTLPYWFYTHVRGSDYNWPGGKREPGRIGAGRREKKEREAGVLRGCDVNREKNAKCLLSGKILSNKRTKNEVWLAFSIFWDFRTWTSKQKFALEIKLWDLLPAKLKTFFGGFTIVKRWARGASRPKRKRLTIAQDTFGVS